MPSLPDRADTRGSPRAAQPDRPPGRPILIAELLSIGTELTVGDTRDTNAGDLARTLTALGIAVRRIQALPDDLATVSEGFRTAIAAADLVISTGGLGPTPDDLTRESIAAAVGETPAVDPGLERWLRDLWARRGMPFPEINLKQAWLIPSAVALPNPNGTAPGWWIQQPDGRIVVALPGPPREMAPMWADHVLPRLRERGAGADVASRTLRLARIGESQLADLLGEALLRATDPVVATYARADAVDVRVSARGVAPDGSTAAERVERTAAAILDLVGDRVWAEGETSWPAAIGAELERAPGRGTLAVVEIGSGGSLERLLGDADWLSFAESLAATTPAAREQTTPSGLEQLARHAMELGEATVGVALRVRSRGRDTGVSVVVAGPGWTHRERAVVFLGGANGRLRAALAAVEITLRALRERGVGAPARRTSARSRQ